MTSNSDLNKEGFVTLNPAEELSLREEVKDAARKQCNNEIKEFVECTRNGVLSVIWKCKPLVAKMNECLGQHTTPEHFDKARSEKLKRKLERLKQEGGGV